MSTRNVVVIGASAGGVEALQELVHALSPSLRATLFIVLHMPPYARTNLPGVLANAGRWPAVLAEDGLAFAPGTIYVSPNDRHLVLQGDRMRLTNGPRENRVRPCVDVLFRSAAIEFGPRAIGVLLSGMLDDGTAGLWAIKDQGGIAIVQEPDSAECPDMPSSALKHVAIDYCLNPRDIAAKLTTLTADPLEPLSKGGDPMHLKLESEIAIEGNALKSGVLKLGELSPNTCPECHGVMVKIREGSIVRYRCHTGHAYSLESLLVDVKESITNGLWAAIRAIEEQSLLLRELEQVELYGGNHAAAGQRAQEAEDASQRAQRIRELVVGAPSGDP